VARHQLALSPHAPAFVQSLVASAASSETVLRSDAAQTRRKFGPRRMVHALSHCARPGEPLAVLYSAVLPGMPASLAQVDAFSGGTSGDGTTSSSGGGEGFSDGRWDLAQGLSQRGGLPATTVAFYSVSAPHAGTRGLRMGTRLIYETARWVADTQAALVAQGAAPGPDRRIDTFCTLSPVPDFLGWLGRQAAASAAGPFLEVLQRVRQDRIAFHRGRAAAGGTAAEADAERRVREEEAQVAAAAVRVGAAAAAVALPEDPAARSAAVARLLLATVRTPGWLGQLTPDNALLRRQVAAEAGRGGDVALVSRRADQQRRELCAVQAYLLLLCRAYLLLPARAGPHCKVAAFHLGNGAELHRLNWAADPSAAGMDRSAGIMVNYLYSSSGLPGLAHTMREGAAAYARDPKVRLAAQNPIITWGVAPPSGAGAAASS
jgi:hypothetical protein